jgi:ADP-ribose pyrophosphatase
MNSPTTSWPRQLIHQGQRINLYHVQVPRHDGRQETKEYVAHPGSVVILPVQSDGRVCLIRNYRYSAGTTLWELPAGTLEGNEVTLPAARRELQEETGYQAGKWRLLSEFWVSPGVFGEKMWLYLAQDLVAGPQRLDATEQIEPVLLNWDEAMQMALQGTIQDAKTLVGLLLWDRLRHDGS